MKYLLLFFLFTFSVHGKERIVVLDFVHSRNVSEAMVVSSYKYFVSELNKTGEFSIIEKSQMKEVLKEIAFQQTGCTDTVCEIKIGEMLAADKIVSGNIIKKEKKYIITITTRNVKDKSLEFSETMDLYNLNKIEITMNTFVQRMLYPEGQVDRKENRETTTANRIFPLTKEELELIKNNQRLEKESEIKRQALNRSIIIPGWGHFYLNQNKEGYILSSLYSIGMFTFLYNITYKDKMTIGEIKTDAKEERVFYYFINQNINPSANHPVVAYYSIEHGNSILRHHKSQMWNINLASITLALLTTVAAMGDINFRFMQNSESFYYFSIRPEIYPSSQNTNSYSAKGSHLEVTYKTRF